MKRREFLKTFAGHAALTVVPRHVLGGVGYTAPSDQLTKGIIGVGGMAEAITDTRVRVWSRSATSTRIIWRPDGSWPARKWRPIPTIVS